MCNKESYDRVFIESFDLEKNYLNAKLEYYSIETWVLIGHVTQMTA